MLHASQLVTKKNYLLVTVNVFLSTPIPFSVKDLQFGGNAVLICVRPCGVISRPPKPISTLCRMPPAPVEKYGLVPPFVSGITRNGGTIFGSYASVKKWYA